MKVVKAKNYSKDELLALKAMVKSGISYSLISKILKRGERGVAVKASRLGFTNNNKHVIIVKRKKKFYPVFFEKKKRGARRQRSAEV